MSDDITIRVTGVGTGANVVVDEGATVADALENAGIENADNLDVRIDGTPVQDASEVRVEQSSNVTVVPKKPALG